MSRAEACREELAALVATHGDDLPLDRAMLLIAAEEHVGLDLQRYLDQLDRLAERAGATAARTRDLTAAITQTLFAEEGFRGNAEDYYDPKNSLLDQVLERRLGIPITLSIVFMEVARRTGSRAEGVGFPGHFLVRHEVEGRTRLLDPFDKGAILRRADCERLLAEATNGREELAPWMLERSPPRAILLRVLTNLKHAYVLQKDLIGAVRAVDRLLLLDPERWIDRRDRGLMYVELECVSAAVRDLEAYAEHAQEGRDVELIRRVLPDLKQQLHVMN